MSVKITKRILYGNEATLLKKQILNNTHTWTLFVRAFDDEDLELYNMIEVVIFHLHESFSSPHRRKEQPPFEITENGWGEFEALIEIVFKHNMGSITLKHFIMLFNQDKTKKNYVSHVCFDQVVFINPQEEVFKLLNSPAVYPNWKAGNALKNDDLFLEEKDALKKVQAKLQNELQTVESEYHNLLGLVCKKKNLLTE
ncbi:YEATS domain containing protein, putative [Entamoeba invadens IP1]|uniref:YEATS domain containing protein, putative n=1 Tax=Entamoeba invadens IP1 TaxID=370355 RepID=L7FNV9_ENTIV|nr:YEATS domain containing protein, putative [Entamoeba invadens IP1]ELP92362.1 YEATS domain containing protein, putative [Entamoeba invadens IP1]|eukprot:XP_004259133.1 YEATS domain containing protein, putative [Entamoeba invadens IP1]